MYRIVFWTLQEKARVGCLKRTASKHVYYLGWNRSPTQVGCMRQALEPGALGRPRGIRWRGRREGGSGWGTHVNPWLIHFNVWQNPLQEKKKKQFDPWLVRSIPYRIKKASLVPRMVKNPHALLESWVRFLGYKDPLENTQSSILAWEIPRTEEPGRLQSMWLQRVGRDWVTNTNT